MSTDVFNGPGERVDYFSFWSPRRKRATTSHDTATQDTPVEVTPLPLYNSSESEESTFG